RRLSGRLGRAPSLEDLAEAAGVATESVRDLTALARPLVSLDAPVGDEESPRFGEMLADDKLDSPFDSLAAGDVVDQAGRALARLDAREERILRLRFGIGVAREQTLAEIGRQFSLTRERIRQIEAKALKKLRDNLK